jgi:hypothetical protein
VRSNQVSLVVWKMSCAVVSNCGSTCEPRPGKLLSSKSRCRPRGHEIDVPIEQAGIEGLRHEEGVVLHLAIGHEHHRNAVRVIDPAAGPRVAEDHLRLAEHIAVDDEIVGDRAGRP